MSTILFRHFACAYHVRNFQCLDAGCNRFCNCRHCCSGDAAVPWWYPVITTTAGPTQLPAANGPNTGNPSQEPPQQHATHSAEPVVDWHADLQRRAAEADFKRQEEMKDAECKRQEEVKHAEHQHKLAEIAAATRALRESGNQGRRPVSPQYDRARSGNNRERNPLLYYPEDHQDEDEDQALLYHRPEAQPGTEFDSDEETRQKLSKPAQKSVYKPACDAANKTKRRWDAFEEGGRKSTRVTARKEKKVKTEEWSLDDSNALMTVKAEDDPFI